VLPGNAWAQVQEATAYSQSDRPADAAKDLKAALDAGYPDPKGGLHALLAAQLRKLGRTEEARHASETAIKLADAYQQQAQPGPDDQP
jgi:Flp pilus assembly protein TadD